MWRLEKEFLFEASHQLPHHDGKCKRLHGHSFKGRLVCEGHELQYQGPKQGMLIEYADMKQVMKPLLENYLDHHHLNETLKLESPTAEEIARWIYDQVKIALPLLTAVIIDETCTSRCEYRP
jgi:6-pyruvoyltetrahydropterin/6-carboxytetrahydropterin synthase